MKRVTRICNIHSCVSQVQRGTLSQYGSEDSTNSNMNSCICSYYEDLNIEYWILNRRSRWDNELDLFISYQYKC